MFDGNAQRAALAVAGDRLLGVDDQIHEDLMQEFGVGFQGQPRGRRRELNRNIFLRERRALLVNRRLQRFLRPHFFTRQRRRPRIGQQILHDHGGGAFAQ